MATFLGDVRYVRFERVVGQTDEYDQSKIVIDGRFDSNDGPLFTYFGQFTYTEDSEHRLVDFDGVINKIEYRDYEGSEPLGYFNIGSISLAVSDLKSANFDKNVLLPELFAGNDLVEGRQNSPFPDHSQVLKGYAGNDVIYGYDDADQLDGGEGNDLLDGGTEADTMTGGTGNDTFVVDDRHDVVVEHAGEGYDKVSSSVTYTLKGADVEALALMGSAAIGAVGNELGNKLVGNGAGNKMQGDDGNDALYGGAGKDALYGGSGNDTFVFDTALGSGNVDAIHDFGNTIGDNDRFKLDHAVFAELTGTGVLGKNQFAANASGTAADANDRIVYETGTGKLFYDADGNGAGRAVQFAVIVNFAELKGGAALSASDFLVA